MLDLDRAIAERAVARKLVKESDVTRCEKLVEERRAQGQRTYLSQVLVQERLLDPQTLVELQDDLGAAIYECPRCERRHSAIELGSSKTFACKGCGLEVRLRSKDRVFSQVEVLASRDPRDLTVSLRVAESSTASLDKVTEVDLTRYKVEGELGRGGYGVVFLARDSQMERQIALKVLKATQELSKTQLERFIREGRAASKLKHPNICQVYDIGRSKDVVALAMELVKGTALRDRILEGPIPWREACELQLGILAGMEHAHEKGVIHRDLKPANIIIEEATGRPRIIDFGLAKDVKANVELTGAGQILGTPFYLAPEQVEGRSNEVDARSDVFALGVIFYEMLTSKRPFVARTRNEVYVRILSENPDPPSALVADVPEPLDQVVMKSLRKKADDRFPTAKAFAEAISNVLASSGEVEAAARKPKKQTAARRVRPEGIESARKRTPLLAHVGIAGAAILVVGAGFAFLRSPAHPPEVAHVEPPPTPPAEPPPASKTPPPVVAQPPAPPASPPPPPPAVAPEPPPPEEAKPVEARVEEPPPQTPPPPPATPAAADPAPVNSAVGLDDGLRDAKEFPSLTEAGEKDWVVRAFTVNAYAGGPKTPTSVRALRLALTDKQPLVRAFALRGLALRGVDDLRAWGSAALFNRLVENLAVKKGVIPYVPKQARVILKALAEQDLGDAADAWRAWWKQDGAAKFLEVARDPNRKPPPPPTDDDRKIGTREKEAGRYLTQARDTGLDAVLCIDVTDSMGGTIQAVKDELRELVSFFELLGHEAKAPVRLGVITYGDEVVSTLTFTEKLPEFARWVESTVNLFIDPNDKTVEEGPDRAIAKAMKDPVFKWRPKARKVLVLIGDAPAHKIDEPACFELVKDQTKKHGFIVNALICQPPAKFNLVKHPEWDPHPEFKKLAELTGGITSELKDPVELITQLLVLLLGSQHEEDIRSFVKAYREVVPPG